MPTLPSPRQSCRCVFSRHPFPLLLLLFLSLPPGICFWLLLLAVASCSRPSSVSPRTKPHASLRKTRKRYTPTTVLTTRRFRQIALTALLFAVILCLLCLLLAPHANGHFLPWYCLAPFLLFAAADFRRTLSITGSTVDQHLSPVRALISRLQLPPPAHTA